MPSFYSLEPEVAGGLGPQTLMDRSTHPPHVARLHYEVSDWFGDCLVQTFPCYLVTRRFGTHLIATNLQSFEIVEAIVSEADEFRDINPDGVLPDLVWLQSNGVAGLDDIGLTLQGKLVVSEPVLDLLRAEGLTNCSIALWVPGTN